MDLTKHKNLSWSSEFYAVNTFYISRLRNYLQKFLSVLPLQYCEPVFKQLYQIIYKDTSSSQVFTGEDVDYYTTNCHSLSNIQNVSFFALTLLQTSHNSDDSPRPSIERKFVFPQKMTSSTEIFSSEISFSFNVCTVSIILKLINKHLTHNPTS